MNIRSLQLQRLVEDHVHEADNRSLITHLLEHLETLDFLFFSLFLFHEHLTAQLLNEILKRIPLLILIFNQLNDRHRIAHPQLQLPVKLVSQFIQCRRVQWIEHAQVQNFSIQTDRQALILAGCFHRNQFQQLF